MRRTGTIVPMWVKTLLRPVRSAVRKVTHRGRGRFCPVCEKSSGRFASFGVVPRPDALCVHCGSLERHRFVWVFLQEQTDLFGGDRRTVLHVAPEECLEPRLRERLGAGYITADLHDPRAMVRMDVTDIGYPDDTFDAIYCSHVLEHVQDDRKAMRELRRVLKPDGWAILLVPITAERTFEDPSIVDPEERLRVFGQIDHVRRYGPDYVDRLRDAGYSVEQFSIADVVDRDRAVEMRLTAAVGDIFMCRKGGCG